MDENKDRDIPTTTRPITLMPGAKECLSKISLQMGLWANTESTETEIRAWLSRANLVKYFGCVVSSTDIGYSKPSAEFFLAALAQCGFVKEEVLFVGNQLSSDIKGANDFGIKNVWLSDKAHRSLYDKLKQGDVEPTYEASSLVEVPGLIEQITKEN